MSAQNKLVSYDEIAKHNTKDSCWIVLNDKVYDVTSFLEEHPGGASIILREAGKDATAAFSEIHPPTVLKILSASALLGVVDPKSKSTSYTQPSASPTHREAAEVSSVSTLASGIANTVRAVLPEVWKKPPLEHMLNLHDFENVAKRVMKKSAWDYYSSGADDEITLRENHAAFQRIWLKPRILINVKSVDPATHFFGAPVSFPLYVTATALGKLGHPDGELAITRACHDQGIIQMIPTLASYSFDEIVGAKTPSQIQWLQLYVNQNKQVNEDIIRKAEKAGVQALCITVDAPQLGRREKDMRNKFEDSKSAIQSQTGQKVLRNQGTARALSSFIDPSLNWDDLKWFQSTTKMPIVLKGIQCAEDAVLAVEHGVQGIILSNHGGRQLDFARSAIEILPEVMEALRAINAVDKLEVYIDGGIRRETDIFKAVALGAKGVGIGRPILYGLAGYGQDGVWKVIQTLKDEFETCMMLMGTTKISQIHSKMLVTRNISDHFVPSPTDMLSHETYMPLPKL